MVALDVPGIVRAVTGALLVTPGHHAFAGARIGERWRPRPETARTIGRRASAIFISDPESALGLRPGYHIDREVPRAATLSSRRG